MADVRAAPEGPASPAPVRVRMFGALQVTTARGVLDARDFPGLKPKQLLEVLLCERGHRVSKGRLAEQLWGEALPRDHAATLETYASVLRRTLDPGAPARASVVVTEHGGYRIGPGGIDVDLDEFDRLTEQAVGADPSPALANLQAALGLVRGDVLEDEPYAAWAQPLRDRYRERVSAVLVDAGRLALVTGDGPTALAHARRAVELSPLAEPAYQLLMTAAYSLWRQDEALAAFDRCRRLLADELGADPLDETVALHMAILRHESIAELLPTAAAAASDVHPPAAAPVAAELPLLARDDELAQLRAAVERARSGQLTLALVTGTMGLGKTRLVEHLASGLDMPVASNRCSDLESGFPYLTLSLALRGVLPELAAHQLPAIDQLMERAERSEPFDQFARLAAMETFAMQLRGRAPFLLWLDDVQWADAETMTTLGYLQRRCADAGIAIVLTCGRPPATVEALRSLRPDRRIDLGLLPQAAVDALGHDGLFAATAGHPLFVSGWLSARQQGLRQSFPPHLCERVVTNCWDAGPQAYRLLSVAAALDGPSFRPEMLAMLVEVGMNDIAAELDGLVEQGYLTWVGDEVAFTTPAVRSILLDALSPARRSLIRQQSLALQGPPRRRASDFPPPPDGVSAGQRRLGRWKNVSSTRRVNAVRQIPAPPATPAQPAQPA